MGARYYSKAARRRAATIPVARSFVDDFPRKLTPAEYAAGLRRIVEEWRKEQEAKRCSR